ncbi:MAG: type II toxin-antitoxin system RelE/ParE family toxin [Dehalococcoidia bacterium]|nr:type II toxin-antitoxin system RelE/ParE family toxin [Dehalococcoidia bacterium]
MPYCVEGNGRFVREILYGGGMSNEQTFRVALSREAYKYYTKVSIITAERLDKCFANLENEPITGSNIKPLKQMAGKYRYRIGNLRVIYEIDIIKRTVNVIAILPRGQAYKK